MKRTRVLSDHVAEPEPGLWSNCLTVGNVAYVAGLSSRGRDGMIAGADEYEQTRAIFEKMHHLLTAAGGSLNDIVKLTVFVLDISKNALVWRARREFFTGDFPACSLVQISALTLPDMLVEIEAVAHLGSSTAAD